MFTTEDTEDTEADKALCRCFELATTSTLVLAILLAFACRTWAVE